MVKARKVTDKERRLKQKQALQKASTVMKQSFQSYTRKQAAPVQTTATVEPTPKPKAADAEAKVEAKARADTKAAEDKVAAQATAQEKKLNHFAEMNKKLGDEVARLKATNEGLSKLRDALEKIISNHREVGDQLQTAIARSHSDDK